MNKTKRRLHAVLLSGVLCALLAIGGIFMIHRGTAVAEARSLLSERR